MFYSGNEIITFQFGHYANFIGAHWWNCQEAGFEYKPDTPSEINNDVLFREGQTRRDEVTFTPRLLLVDLKGSLGCLPEAGRLYDPPALPDPALPLWPADRVTVQTAQEPGVKNDFLQDLEQSETASTTLPEGLKEKGQAVPKLYHLDDAVQSWSDFLRPHLHPRSVTVVQEYQHNDPSLPFETFPQGTGVWEQPDFNEDFTDRIRCYMEETDNLQGFQILMDNLDGFSGLGCAALQQLRDDYPTKTALCWAVQPPQPAQDTRVRLINQALALASLAEHSNMLVPVSGTTGAWKCLGKPVTLPHLRYKAELLYHSAAVVAAAVDSVSLLYRLRSSAERVADVTSRLTLGGRRAVAMSAALPLPLRCKGTFLDTLEACEGPLTHSLTPGLDLFSDTVWQQAYVLRGVPESRLMRESQMDSSSENPAYSCRTLAQLLKTYLSFSGHSTASTQVATADCAFRTSAPFPHIFDQHITADGQLDDKPRPPYLGVESVPVLAGLHSTKSIGALLETLHSEAQKVNVRSVHQFGSSGLESLELSESLEQLLCLSENYSDTQMDF